MKKPLLAVAVFLALISPIAQAHKSLESCPAYLTGTSQLRLKVATWNLNLLKFPGVEAPHYKERSARLRNLLGQYLSSPVAPDILMMQEIWKARDHLIILEVARHLGYQVMATNLGELPTHGMQVLVKSGVVSRVQSPSFWDFSQRASFERFTLVRRGLLWARLELINGQSVLLANTHLSPFTSLAHVRQGQVQSIAEFLCVSAWQNDHVILGGDLNIATNFSCPTKSAERRHQKASWLYEYFNKQTGLQDTHRLAKGGDDLLTYNSKFPALNNLRKSKSKKRLDYIWSATYTKNATLNVITSGVEFTEPLGENGLIDPTHGIYPSDHFLYYAVLEFGQRVD